MGDAIWYATIDGAEQGPLTGTALSAMARAGRISRETPVRREGMAASVPASAVTGLLPPVGSTTRTTAAIAASETPAATASPDPVVANATTRRQRMTSPTRAVARPTRQAAKRPSLRRSPASTVDADNPFAPPESGPADAAPDRDQGFAVAGVGRRFAAMFIDAFLHIASLILLVMLLAPFVASSRASDRLVPIGFMVFLCVMLIGSPYWVISEWLWAATPGKLMLRMRVVDRHGKRVRFGAALGRNLLRGLLAWVVPFGGFLDAIMGLIDEQRRSLHDRAAGTLVVHLDTPLRRRRRPASIPRRLPPKV
jgi:uncharacterized RDD family membrane protein YckC